MRPPGKIKLSLWRGGVKVPIHVFLNRCVRWRTIWTVAVMKKRNFSCYDSRSSVVKPACYQRRCPSTRSNDSVGDDFKVTLFYHQETHTSLEGHTPCHICIFSMNVHRLVVSNVMANILFRIFVNVMNLLPTVGHDISSHNQSANNRTINVVTLQNSFQPYRRVVTLETEVATPP